jgi:hypothetical protein
MSLVTGRHPSAEAVSIIKSIIIQFPLDFPQTPSHRMVRISWRRKGKERQTQLNQLVQKWVLRRDKSLIADQLPGKDDNVVFCKLAGMQVRYELVHFVAHHW